MSCVYLYVVCNLCRKYRKRIPFNNGQKKGVLTVLNKTEKK